VSAERRNAPAVVETAALVKTSTLRTTLAGTSGDRRGRRACLAPVPGILCGQYPATRAPMAYYRAVCHFFAWVEGKPPPAQLLPAKP